MSETKIFRDQHDELLKIASEISKHLSIDVLSKDAHEVRRLLSELLGNLDVHLTMEDKALYPQLLAHSDGRVKSVAGRFVYEMGGIGETLKDYRSKWRTPAAIQKDPSDFIKQTKAILDALTKRIEKENNELYKMVDELSV